MNQSVTDLQAADAALQAANQQLTQAFNELKTQNTTLVTSVNNLVSVANAEKVALDAAIANATTNGNVLTPADVQAIQTSIANIQSAAAATVQLVTDVQGVTAADAAATQAASDAAAVDAPSN